MAAESRDFAMRIEAEIARAVPAAWSLLDGLATTPELGFFEHETSEQLKQALERLGFVVEAGLARTGLRTDFVGTAPRPRVAVLGELDALPLPEHPAAREGVAHACGHHAQLVILYLVAAALRGLKAELGGSVAFIATPAEELVDIERRLALRESGEIEFLGGKAELIRLGVFDDIDAALLVHLTTRREEGELALGGRMNGMVAKHVRYIGRAAHAAASPHLGVNALSAAHVALAALNAARESVREEDHIRFSAIIRAGGVSPNVLPDDVRMETLVRGASTAALADAERAAQRAFRAGAIAVGAGCTITTIPGYLPLLQDERLLGVCRSVAERIADREILAAGVDRAGSTDLGDLSHLMPVVQPWAGGVAGGLHSADFSIKDRNAAILRPALLVATAITELLLDGASVGKGVLRNFRPAMAREEYLAYLRRTFASETIDLPSF